MFKIESYFGPLLMSYLNKYVKLDEESFKLSLWGGDVTFHNLELQYDILEDLMPMPIGFKSGQVHELKVHVPWTKLGSESVVITLNTVECIIALKSEFVHNSKADNFQKESPNLGQKQRLEKNIPPGYLKSYLVNIINNIHVKVNNLIIKFVEDDIVLSMNAKSLEYLPATHNWSRGFIDFSSGNLLVHKIVQVSDLTVCLDQMDANGHIELYQEPILYRCSVECRFVLQYQSFVSNKPNFLKFNIKFGNLELNVTISQIPMIRRLIELFYALYYNTINWDNVVGCGFSNQMSKVPVKIKEPENDANIESSSLNEEVDQSSWSSWAWSYVPSMFAYDENLLEEDNFDSDLVQDVNHKKTIIFGIFFDSLQINLKKSQIIKSHYETHRSGRSQKTILFMTLKGNNIGLNLTSYGLGFFNVQLGCTDINLSSTGDICPCGQLYKVEDKSKICHNDIGSNNLMHMGTPNENVEALHDFYLTGSLFSVHNDNANIISITLNKLNNVCSQETYAVLYSQDECLDKFSAVWFDYVYCMQIVNNDMHESQIDLSNLCNTDGIRESSVINLYLGLTTLNVNSYFVHNVFEITKALDISKYSTYFKVSNNDDRRSNVFYPTEDQVARIHEFIPIRYYNISLNNLTINIHTFLESHNFAHTLPMIEVKTKSIKFSESSPKYPIHLIDCVSVLNTNLLKESKELLNKCYLPKSLEINGLSISLVIKETPDDGVEDPGIFIKSEIIRPCSISFTHKEMLHSDSWKTAQFINDEKTMHVSMIHITMIPSHLKTAFVIAMSNYSWIANYFQFYKFPSNLTQMNHLLDEFTLKLMDPNSSLVRTCFKNNYEDKTYELHVSLPSAIIKSWKTLSSYFIDAKILHDPLFLYLKEPLSSKIIPVLDNKLDEASSHDPTLSPPFCMLYCQIPIQTKPVNCVFSFHCQVGSINCMFSSQLVNWFIFPKFNFDFDDFTKPRTISTYSRSRESPNIIGPKILNDQRSTADGNSRPQSPTVLFNAFPVPGHPRSVSTIDNSLKTEIVSASKIPSGWWNLFKDGCSKYYFFLQSLDVCIKMRKSKFHIVTVTDTMAFQLNVNSCNQWVERFVDSKQCSVFLITMTRLALINSQRKEYLDDNFERNSNCRPKYQQTKSSIFIESLPWELIFHDIQVDCVHSHISDTHKYHTIYDSILKPVSINCTLSATPKCSSPERLDTLYSISWGIHVDITEVQPTLKQIYLIKLLDFFVNICLKVSSTEFRQKQYQFWTGHYFLVKNYNRDLLTFDDQPIFISKHSVSSKSTLKSTSLSSTIEHKMTSLKYKMVSSKSETQSALETDIGFKLSFWIQCTLSQFQFIILLNDNEDGDVKEPGNVCLVMQIDDVTGSVDIQEKFVEIKSKFGSIFCQLGIMNGDQIISEAPILKSGSKFLSTSQLKDDHIDDIQLDGGNRHCLSAAIIRTTVNNLSQRPLSTYHQFHDTDSFKSYPTEFTGNFSTPPDVCNSGQNFVTQISSIIEPFELIVSSYAIEQCHKLTDTLISIYLRFFNSVESKNYSSNKVNVSLIKVEPYFISEDMPKFHLLIKSSKIIIPCDTTTTISDQKNKETKCIILSWNKISLQPFSDNPISRPKVTGDCKDEYAFNTKCDSTVNSMESESKLSNSLDDNRQFQLNIVSCGIFTGLFSALVFNNIRNTINYDINLPIATKYIDAFGASITHGQNPAFEWNNYSNMSASFLSRKSSDVRLKPILRPIDIHINFAGVLYQNSDNILQRNLLGGYGLEINVLTSVEFLIDMFTIESMKSVFKSLNKLFSYENLQLPNRGYDVVHIKPAIHSINDWIVENKLCNIIPCVPINILVTTRKIQCLLLLHDKNNPNIPSQVHGVCLSISQPHLLLDFRDRDCNKLEVSLFDINLSVTPTIWSESLNLFDARDPLYDWTGNQDFILAEMRTILKTKPGSLNMKTGVPKSFFTVTFLDFYQGTGSKLKLDFSRQITVDLDISDIETIVKTLSCIIPILGPVSYATDEIESTSRTFSWSIVTPRYTELSAELMSLRLGCNRQFESCFEIKMGKIHIKSDTTRNYDLNNRQSSIWFSCDSVLFNHSVKCSKIMNCNDNTIILRPLKIMGKCQFRQYRPDSVDTYWMSSEFCGDINVTAFKLTVDRHQLVTLQRMIQIIDDCLEPLLNCVSVSPAVQDLYAENRVEMFYDDLRSERFQIHTKLSVDSGLNDSLHMIADDGTVTFSEDGEDLAAMYWSYPEARFITCVEVKPVPFVFIEYKLTKEDNYENLQIPCQLEYWSSSNNCYEIYKMFHLSENQVERVDDFPTLETQSHAEQCLMIAKSWRVVVDCYARYKQIDNENNITYSKRAMLIYLSPLVLAASMKVDSCYAPSFVRNSFISIATPLLQIEFLDMEQEIMTDEPLYKPFKQTRRPNDDRSIADHSVLFTVTLKNVSSRYLFAGEFLGYVSSVLVHIADPFVALKTAILTINDINLELTRNSESKLQSNISVKLGLVQASIDTFCLRQLITISEKMTELWHNLYHNEISAPTLNSHKLLFCNFLDRRIRLRQLHDSFYQLPDNSKFGGIFPGEAVNLKFLPTNYCKYHKTNAKPVPYDPIKLTLGLCSELKGTVRWTESIELPHLTYEGMLSSSSNLTIWNIDSTSIEAPVCSNSSNLSNSYNAKSLLLLHTQSIVGLNKLILMGNTMFNNLTTDSIHVNFSLPTEISSGFSFDIAAALSNEIVTSIHINWKVVSFASPRNSFELSFRVGSGVADNVGFRSQSYTMNVPKFLLSKYQYQHTIIKLKEHKSDVQVLTSRDQWRQILCTMEWFQLTKNDDIFLLMTLSPLITCKNLMLDDVDLHLSWLSEDQDSVATIKENVKITGNGGLLNVTNFFTNKSIEVNASFLNDSKLLFEKPLALDESDLINSLDQNLRRLYDLQYQNYDHNNICQNLSGRLVNIINKDNKESLNNISDNPYSVMINITPWILVTNCTKMTLFLGFDRNIYLLEAMNDFIPPQYNKPVKIGIAHDNEIFWSKTFAIGDSIIDQNNNVTPPELLWNIVETIEGTSAFLQINIVLVKYRFTVPITLRHTFTYQYPTQTPNTHQPLARYNSIVIESSVYVNNQTEHDLNVLPVSITKNLSQDPDISVDQIYLPAMCTYIPIEKFINFEDSCDTLEDPKWFLSLTTSGQVSDIPSFSNIVSLLSFKRLTKYRDSENITYTNFSYVEVKTEESAEIDFIAFTINSTLDYRTHKSFTDIFECKTVPIKITNHSSYKLLINQYEDNNGSIVSIIRPKQSVPFWPNNFVLDINKDGCANFDNIQFRIRMGTELKNDTDWTDYFPINVSNDSSLLDIVTKNSRQHLFIQTSYSADAKMHIHIHEHNIILIPESTVPHQSFSTNISIAKCILSVFEIGFNLESAEEAIRLTLDNSSVLHSYNSQSQTVCQEIAISDMQLDNMRYQSGMYDFPVVIYSRSRETSHKCFHCLFETDSCGMNTINVKFDQEIEVFVENIFLYDMLRVFGKLSQCIDKSPSLVALYSYAPLNLGSFNISSIPLLITVHAFLKIYVSCEATSLSLPKFACSPSLISFKTIQRKLYEHYVTAALIRCGWVMGSFEILGNPSGIVNHLTTGFSNLMCSKNIDQGLLADFLLRIFSFCRYTTGGLVSSFTGIASSVSRNLDYFCLDDTHITRQDSFRRQNQPSGVMHGFVQGLSGFALSLLGAIAGLADHPLHDSQEALNNNSSVTIAVLKGLGKGLVGIVTKPLSGTAELFAQTGRGLLRTTGITILRCHCPEDTFAVHSRTELLIDESRVLHHVLTPKIIDDSYSTSEVFFYVWSGIGTNGQGQLVYVFLTNDFMLEWNIDNPLHNQHNVYPLSEYDVVLCPVSLPSSGPSVIRLHHIHQTSNQPLSTDFRINAFLTEQLCDSCRVPVIFSDNVLSASHSSSLDSTDFVTISDHNKSGSTDFHDNKATAEPTDTIVFTFENPADGLVTALTFLQLNRNNVCSNCTL